MAGSCGCAAAASPSDRGRATLRPRAPKYALRDSASVANSSAVWAQPPRDASAPAFSPVPPRSRSCSFPVCCGQVGGLSGGHDGGQEVVGWGGAAGSQTPCREWCGWRAAHACTSCPLDTPTTSILLAFARGLRSERGPRRVPVHYRQRTRFCLCVRRSSPYVVAVRARITRRLAPVCLPAPVYAAQL